MVFNWGFMQQGAFVQFAINVQVSGLYALTLLESSWQSNAGVKVYLNGALVGSIGFVSQGSWQQYLTSDALTLTLPSGPSTLKVQDSTGVGFNLAGVTITPGATGIPILANTPTILPIRTAVVSGFTADPSANPFNWGFMQPNAYLQYTINVQVSITVHLQ